MRINFTKSTLEALPAPAKGRVYYHDSKTRGLALGVSWSGTKTFVLYRKIKGRPERITIGRFPDKTIEQARGEAGTLNGSIASGENPADKRRVARREMTLQQLFDEYIERHAQHNKRTWQEDIRKFDQYLTSKELAPGKRYKEHRRGLNLATKKLSQLTRADFAQLHSKITKHAPVTANRVVALVSSIYGRAIEWGYWDLSNPASGIKQNRETSRDRFLHPDELPKFFESLAAESNPDMRDFLVLALLTGARRSNVLAMRWEDINLEREEWRIPETKNGTPQRVALVPEAISILKARKPEGDPTGYVFPGRKGNKHGHMTGIYAAWARVLKRANVSGVWVHDLRRTLGSWQARTGASLTIIGKSLNHMDTSTTAIYARLDIDPVRESVERATSAILAAAARKPSAKVHSINKAKHVK